MRVLIESGYLWLGSSSFEVEPHTTVADLCRMFHEQEGMELEQFVFSRKLLPDDMPDLYPDEHPIDGGDWKLEQITLTMGELGVEHGSRIHAIMDRPLPVLKSSVNTRDVQSEQECIELGKRAVAEQKHRDKQYDAKQCARELPADWVRKRGDAQSRKPGVWYYEHSSGKRQWSFPVQEDAYENITDTAGDV
eukprot:TRINITY_DN24251_c0_g1_i2.p1 TRINITY_DN24251_c0_g1~~TRINITY_DN24251_c0_g1_i2.p1  ORF type:complete len:192 (+),score=45.68 TRINITY_DN24251_c0_g1_i2:245-820(+)